MDDHEKSLRGKRKFQLNLIDGLKVGFGSALAIFIAVGLNLPSPASAGTITLLTLVVQTRKDTAWLIARRVLSYLITVGICWLLFPTVSEPYLAFGIFLFAEVVILESLGWKDTLSVNAVIGVQFLINQDFSALFIAQEFAVLLVGMSIALVLNLLQPMSSGREWMKERIRKTDHDLQDLMMEISHYLACGACRKDLWDQLEALRVSIREDSQDAVLFAKNAFYETDRWMADYFETRYHQLIILHQLHEHLQMIDSNVSAGMETARIARHLSQSVCRAQVPKKEMDEIDSLFVKIQNRSDGRDFASHAMLLHICLDLKEYTELKADFVEHLSSRQLEDYQKLYRKDGFRPLIFKDLQQNSIRTEERDNVH